MVALLICVCCLVAIEKQDQNGAYVTYQSSLSPETVLSPFSILQTTAVAKSDVRFDSNQCEKWIFVTFHVSYGKASSAPAGRHALSAISPMQQSQHLMG